MSAKGALEKDLSRLFLRVRFFLIYILDLFLGQLFLILVFAGDAKFAPRISGRDDVSTGVETDGQPKVRRAVVTRRLVLLAGGFIVMSLRPSTVGVLPVAQKTGWELMEQAFDDGNNPVQMRNLLVLFLIGSGFHLIFAF